MIAKEIGSFICDNVYIGIEKRIGVSETRPVFLIDISCYFEAMVHCTTPTDQVSANP
jgi:hypothetical protein